MHHKVYVEYLLLLFEKLFTLLYLNKFTQVKHHFKCIEWQIFENRMIIPYLFQIYIFFSHIARVHGFPIHFQNVFHQLFLFWIKSNCFLNLYGRIIFVRLWFLRKLCGALLKWTLTYWWLIHKVLLKYFFIIVVIERLVVNHFI